ncbi:MAG TPA: SHOCT domain-containing protein [Gammaproteobacteria bacterium]
MKLPSSGKPAAMAASILAPVLICTSVSAQQPSGAEGYPYGPHMMGWGGGWYGMVFGSLFMILTLAAVIAVAALLVRWIGGPWHGAQPPHPMQPGRTALDILKERYARGDIDKDEFDERRRVIGD